MSCLDLEMTPNRSQDYITYESPLFAKDPYLQILIPGWSFYSPYSIDCLYLYTSDLLLIFTHLNHAFIKLPRC